MCGKPTTCMAGKMMRNGECVSSCGEGELFDGKTSNNCAACPTTNDQGEKTDGTDVAGKYCVKCNQNFQFFDKGIWNCISKTSAGGARLDCAECLSDDEAQCWK
jgi:hypothetical protein